MGGAAAAAVTAKIEHIEITDELCGRGSNQIPHYHRPPHRTRAVAYSGFLPPQLPFPHRCHTADKDS